MVSKNRTLASVLKELETLKDLASSIENDLDEIISQNDEVALLNQEIQKLTEENKLLRLQNARLNAFGKGDVSA